VLGNAVAAGIARAAPPVTVVSGDCLVATAALAGAQRTGLDPALIWFDAHGDVHTLETTTSGYLGGLSLRLAMGAHAGLTGLRFPAAGGPAPADVVAAVRRLVATGRVAVLSIACTWAGTTASPEGAVFLAGLVDAGASTRR
jgi:arginase family enzyme